MNIQENRSDGVASDRRSVYDERRQRRSPATVAGVRRSVNDLLNITINIKIGGFDERRAQIAEMGRASKMRLLRRLPGTKRRLKSMNFRLRRPPNNC